MPWAYTGPPSARATASFTLRFEPNCEYVIEFLSQGGGTIIIRNESGSEVLLSEAM